MDKEKEVRSILAKDIEVRKTGESKDKIIGGYIAKYNCRSQYMGFFEQIQKGAFEKTLADGHNIFALYNHNYDKILGSTKAGTVRVYTDEVGLAFELKVNDNISYANDLYELVQSGDIQGCSFGFMCDKDSWTYDEDGIDLRTLEEVTLYEITITGNPAYLDSEASCRSFEKHKDELEKHKKQEARTLKQRQIAIELDLL